MNKNCINKDLLYHFVKMYVYSLDEIRFVDVFVLKNITIK